MEWIKGYFMAPTSIPHVRLFPIVKNIKDALKKEDNNDNLNYQLEKEVSQRLKKKWARAFSFSLADSHAALSNSDNKLAIEMFSCIWEVKPHLAVAMDPRKR